MFQLEELADELAPSEFQRVAAGAAGGYAFHEEAQAWWSPWQVVRLDEVVEVTSVDDAV